MEDSMVLKTYRVRSGDLDKVVRAETPEDAFRQAVLEMQPESLGLLVGIKREGEPYRYCETNSFLEKCGLVLSEAEGRTEGA